MSLKRVRDWSFFGLFLFLFSTSLIAETFAPAKNCSKGQSESPPDYLSFATGCYNIMKEKGRTWEFEMEYKFHIKWLTSSYSWLEYRPIVGIMGTLLQTTYIYGGINFDLLFFDHLLIAPGFAIGYFSKGKGKNLGYPLEFRSGVEVAWRFSNAHRLGLHFYHLSNASLGSRNPGEESLVLFYDIPLIKGFPFIRDNNR